MIAYASRTLTECEQKYCVTRKELLALVYFVRYFKHYLYGRQFTLRTDHGSLRWLLSFKNPVGQIALWLVILLAFDMTIEHRAGRLHRNADAISRIPCKQCGLQKHEMNIRYKHYANSLETGIENGNVGKPSDNNINLHQEQENGHDIGIVRSWILSNKRPKSKEIESGNFI